MKYILDLTDLFWLLFWLFFVVLQEYLVSHIHSSLEERVVPAAIDQMKTIRKNIMFEMEQELGPAVLKWQNESIELFVSTHSEPVHKFVLAGEQDLDCPAADEKSVRSKYGYQLFSKLMMFLTGNESLWRDTAPCIRHSASTAASSKARAKKKAKTMTKARCFVAQVV